MTKWPKEWIEVVTLHIFGRTPELQDKVDDMDFILNKSPKEILDKLFSIGALKDPPQPREIWWCPKCCGADTFNGMSVHDDPSCRTQPIKMREVIE